MSKAKWNDIRVSAADAVDVYLYDEIGEAGISAADFVPAFDAIQARNINVRINSNGGSIYNGIAIYNAIKRKSAQAQVTVMVDGIAASIASVIAMAGNRVCVLNDAWIMIHEARSSIAGATSEAHQKEADELEKLNVQLAAIYATKTGKSEDAIREMMRAETWLDAATCLAMGFADSISNEGSTNLIGAAAEKSYLKFNRVPEKLRMVAEHHRNATRGAGFTASDLRKIAKEQRVREYVDAIVNTQMGGPVREWAPMR